MNKEKKKQIREKYQKDTEKFLSDLLRKLKIDKAANHFLIWAENNRKGMFLITLLFLLLVVAVSLFFRPTNSINEVYQHQKILAGDTINNPVSQVKFGSVIEIMSLKKEISELECKAKLTPDDSLKILDLYKKIQTFKIKKK